MLRIRFTPEDFGRLRMSPGLGPIAESIFALEVFGRRSGTQLEGWRRRTGARLGDKLVEVHQLGREHRPIPELLWLLEQGSGQLTGRQASTVLTFCRVAVLPYWSRLNSQLEAERDARGRQAIVSGVESMLAGLHPRLRWNPPVLEVLDEPDGEIRLDGRSMVLSPSVFLPSSSLAVIKQEKESGLTALVFPVQDDPVVLAEAGEWESSERVLGALVGSTRAAALFALTESCTTGTLSQRLGISLAGASKHATVLRKAGLVTTTRNRNTALHTLTSLGMALLRNRPATAAEELGETRPGAEIGSSHRP